MPRYKPIELDEVYDLFKIRRAVELHLTKKKSRLRFDKFCDMMKLGGWTIV